MRRVLPRIAVVFAYAITTGCSDAPVAPAATSPAAPADPRLEMVHTPVRASALTRTRRLERDISVTARIGRRGGVVAIPAAGLRVIVPPGAITGADVVNFTATALAGEMVAYDFGPHGQHFARPLQVSQDVHGINWRHAERGHLEAGYFASRSQIDAEHNMVAIDEFLPLDVARSGSKVRFGVVHFSGYILTTGRVQ